MSRTSKHDGLKKTLNYFCNIRSKNNLTKEDTKKFDSESACWIVEVPDSISKLFDLSTKEIQKRFSLKKEPNKKIASDVAILYHWFMNNKYFEKGKTYLPSTKSLNENGLDLDVLNILKEFRLIEITKEHVIPVLQVTPTGKYDKVKNGQSRAWGQTLRSKNKSHSKIAITWTRERKNQKWWFRFLNPSTLGPTKTLIDNNLISIEDIPSSVIASQGLIDFEDDIFTERSRLLNSPIIMLSDELISSILKEESLELYQTDENILFSGDWKLFSSAANEFYSQEGELSERGEELQNQVPGQLPMIDLEEFYSYDEGWTEDNWKLDQLQEQYNSGSLTWMNPKRAFSNFLNEKKSIILSQYFLIELDKQFPGIKKNVSKKMGKRKSDFRKKLESTIRRRESFLDRTDDLSEKEFKKELKSTIKKEFHQKLFNSQVYIERLCDKITSGMEVKEILNNNGERRLINSKTARELKHSPREMNSSLRIWTEVASLPSQIRKAISFRFNPITKNFGDYEIGSELYPAKELDVKSSHVYFTKIYIAWQLQEGSPFMKYVFSKKSPKKQKQILEEIENFKEFISKKDPYIEILKYVNENSKIKRKRPDIKILFNSFLNQSSWVVDHKSSEEHRVIFPEKNERAKYGNSVEKMFFNKWKNVWEIIRYQGLGWKESHKQWLKITKGKDSIKLSKWKDILKKVRKAGPQVAQEPWLNAKISSSHGLEKGTDIHKLTSMWMPDIRLTMGLSLQRMESLWLRLLSRELFIEGIPTYRIYDTIAFPDIESIENKVQEENDKVAKFVWPPGTDYVSPTIINK